MEILTPKTTRRSTRVRVEIPITVTSLDRKHVFAAECMALVVSAQGCGFRTPQALPLETPVLLGNLPGGGTASGRVANCLPLGNDGKQFLIGVSLYNPGNVWGIADPPADWNCAPTSKPASSGEVKAAPATKNVWPYNIFAGQREAHPSRK
ncbi:MAG: PilZ domain-containing protein [Candidatus Sulfotelmatobacter sp.]